jgi:hypothetical protein
MSPLFRRRGKNVEAVTGPPKQAPAYRRDDGAVEYRQEQGGVVPDKVAPKVDPRFRPLPRCRRCGTALGFGQEKCHSCGEESPRH